MVLIYNKKPPTTIKEYKKTKHPKQRISRKRNSQQIASQNKKFLKALCLKVLI